MKLLILIISISIFFLSCKKHYSCECVTNGVILGTDFYDLEVKTTPKMNTNDAEEWCKQYNQSVSDEFNTNYTITCNIK